VVNPNFWRDKAVLITGHTGFKGAWLSLWLESLGARVAGYALEPPTSPSLFELAKVGAGMHSVIGDIRDRERLNQTIRRQQPEIVFHMAAQALVRRGYQEPLETFDVNVLGTACLLEAVRQAGSVKAVVVVTSDKCYGNLEKHGGYKETDALGGDEPYSSSKACAELVTAAYRASYFSNSQTAALATVRAGNVIGGGDWARDRLLPDIMRAVIAGKPVVIRNRDAIRPWQHVLEPLGGYLLLAEKLCQEGRAYADAWNFGPYDDDARTVKEVVQLVMELWGDGAGWVSDGRQHPRESQILKLDCAKAEQRLGWKPRWRFAEALEATVDWYKAYLGGQNLQAVALDQLEKYQSLADGAVRVAGRILEFNE
jgi:CDP-glucose 4,6-dehydratase